MTFSDVLFSTFDLASNNVFYTAMFLAIRLAIAGELLCFPAVPFLFIVLVGRLV